MPFQLVPFGLKVEDDSYVDVADVKRGKDCGCICPSCHTPLVARQGQEKEWHFAHLTRKVDSTDKECDFSFYVSVRMMARQVIESGITLELPELRKSLVEYQKGTYFRENYLITKQTEILLEDVKKEVTFSGSTVDVIGNVKGFLFIIYFTHPDRPIPVDLQISPPQNCGILEIDLKDTDQLFRGKHQREERQLDKLKDFLQNDLESKNWIFHPREQSQEEKARLRLMERIDKYQPRTNYGYVRPMSLIDRLQYRKPKQTAPVPTTEINPKRSVTFECNICHSRWVATLPGLVKCPNGHDHFYATEVKNGNISIQDRNTD